METQKMAFRLFLLCAVLTLSACGGRKEKGSAMADNTAPSVIEVSIGGMFCTDCEQTIQKKVGELAGIKSVKASYVTGTARIEYFAGKVDSATIRQAIAGTGYSVKKFNIPAN